MTSHTTPSFRDALAKLPKVIRARARAAYRRFQRDPRHSSLQFKKVHRTRPIYSARVTDDYRVVGTVEGNEIVWFWIGKHEEYERLLKSL
jgi:mRNA-degrading endonuclease RelE of RelBE toxin-antitoxin system